MSEPHNPQSLTPEQYEAHKGYRLLEVDEITHEGPMLEKIERLDGASSWIKGCVGLDELHTYRTRLSREALAERRGLKTAEKAESTSLNTEDFKEWLHGPNGPSMKYRDGRDSDFGYWLSNAFIAGQREERKLLKSEYAFWAKCHPTGNPQWIADNFDLLSIKRDSASREPKGAQ